MVPGLQELGYHVDYRPDVTREELLLVIGEYQGLIVRSKTIIDQAFLEHSKQLQFVARAGAGLDNLDEIALKQRGIAVVNAPEGNRDSLAEHALGMLLCLLHQLPWAHQSVRSGAWQRETFRGTELGGKTIGLIGYGHMGQAFAKRLHSFNCRIEVYDKYLKGFGTDKVIESRLSNLFDSCDVISLHVPLTEETRGFYNYSFFQSFKKPLILVNTARGEILPLEDLRRLLDEGKVLQVALDVLEHEPISQLYDSQKDTFNYLVNSSRVLMSPHVAGWSLESYQRINSILIKKIAALQASGTID